MFTALSDTRSAVNAALVGVGFDNPGDTASFKVYVVLSTGDEFGSNTVTITRAFEW